MRAVTSLALILTGMMVPNAATAQEQQPEVIPLSAYMGELLSFQVVSHGKPARFLLDTAGGITVISKAFAARIGCRPWGRITGFRMRGDRVDMARCDHVSLSDSKELSLPVAGVLDFSALLPPSAPPIAGSIAMDAFADEAVTLDIAHMRLVIETPDSLRARIDGAQEVRMRFAREVNGSSLTPLVAVETPRGPIWPEIDSGSDGSVILNRPLAGALGADGDADSGRPMPVTLAGGVRFEAPVKFEDLVIDGNIGLDVLRHWMLTIDTVRQRMWVKRVEDGDATSPG
jgi:hypothetical protein